MLKIRLGQVMINVWILWCIIFVVHHALHLLSRRELTFELKIGSLPFECLDVLQWNKTFFLLRKSVCWSGILGLIPLSSFPLKLYLEICGLPLGVVDRLVNLQEFSRQPLSHHILVGVSGSLFLLTFSALLASSSICCSLFCHLCALLGPVGRNFQWGGGGGIVDSHRYNSGESGVAQAPRDPGVFGAKSCNLAISWHFIQTFGKFSFSKLIFKDFQIFIKNTFYSISKSTLKTSV